MNEEKIEVSLEKRVGNVSQPGSPIVSTEETAAKGGSEQSAGEWKKKPGTIREQLRDLVNYRDSQCI